jgi:hypothetical protein
MTPIPLGILSYPTIGGDSLELIDSIELASTAASIEVTSIPTDYTHLMIQLYYIGGSNNVTLSANFNSDTSLLYNTQPAEANGSSYQGLGGDYGIGYFMFDQLSTTSLGYDWLGYIPNYQDSHYKQLIARYGDAASALHATGWYESTDAISAISFQSSPAATLGIGTRLSIWGVL